MSRQRVRGTRDGWVHEGPTPVPLTQRVSERLSGRFGNGRAEADTSPRDTSANEKVNQHA